MADRHFLRVDKYSGKRDVDVNKDNPLPVQLCSPFAQSFVSVFGDQQIAQRVPDILVQFQYNIAPYDVTQSSSGTGSLGHADAMAEAHTGTGVGASSIESIEAVRYHSGHAAYAYFTGMFTAPEANTKQLIGLLDADHGFGVGYNGTDFIAFRRVGGVDDFTNVETLDKLDGNGDSGFKINTSTLNIFRIEYGWLGIAPITFYVWGGFRIGWVQFAVIDLSNNSTVPSIENPVLYMRSEVSRSSGTGADLVLRTGSWGAGILQSPAHEHVGSRHFSYQNTIALGAAALTNVFTLRSVTTFQSVESHIRTELLKAGFSTDGTKPVRFELWLNATLGGTPAYNSRDANNSITEVDIAGTTVSGGTFIDSFQLAKSAGENPLLHDAEIHWHPGDTLTVAAYSTATSDVSATLRWHELF